MKMNQNLSQRLNFLRDQIDESLKKALSSFEIPASVLKDAMVYSAMGGKRLRACIFLDNFQLVGANPKEAMPFAVAIEMIHAYSLVHDDMPPLDNDDLRRGRPSCHKKYGEAVALLCGDGLLALAFEIMLSVEGFEPKVVLSVVKEIAKAAGPFGLVSGQVLDVELEGKNAGPARVEEMYRLKTGKMFSASSASGFLLAGAPSSWVRAASFWGEEFGYAFQILDDLEDLGILGKEQAKDTLIKETSVGDCLFRASKSIEESLRRLKTLPIQCSLMEGLSLEYAQKIEDLRRNMSFE